MTAIAEKLDVAWQPHPGPQTDFCSRWEFEVLFGGAAGPGKTDCLIIEALRYIHKANYRGVILRRTFPQLQEIIDRMWEYYPLYDGIYKSTEHRWHFPSGAKIGAGHMQYENDRFNYQGKEFQYIGFDEAAQFTQMQYLYLFSRARSKDPTIPCRIRAASNPGGVGHAFLKNRFKIGLQTPKTTITDEFGMTRVFIPAKLQDNPTLLENDPMYIQRLMLLPEIERMRLLEGLWDAFEGQAFPELNYDVHGIDPFDIPPEWIRYRSFDWGYASPFSVGWWAVDFDGRLYRYREWYGQKEGSEYGNEGMRMSPTEIARGIKKIEGEAREKVRPGPADPDIWNPRWATMGKKTNFGVIGGSVAEDMSKEGVDWLKADNNNMQGRQQVHKRLELDENDEPQVFIFKDCLHFWRTMQLLREKESNPEEIEGKGVEDHIYDESRYFLMFQPVKPKVVMPDDVGSFQHERRKMIKARKLALKTGISIQQAYGRVRG